MKFFDYDSPLMQFLTKVANLMIINVLTIICCIPIVTIGAALTAMHYMCIKMVRNEDGEIVKGYFKAFKDALKQATGVWLVLLAFILVFFGDYVIVYYSGIQFPYWFQVSLSAVAIVILLVFMMVFPLMGKFYNTTFRTIKNALIISIAKFPITLLILIMNAIPVVITLFFFQLFPMVLMFGMSVPAYGAAKLLNKYFLKLEEHISQTQGGGEAVDTEPEEDERIFHDQLDDGLANYQEKR